MRGYAQQLWITGQRKVNRRLLLLAAICVVASLLFLCATAHAQSGAGSAGGGGVAIGSAPGFGTGNPGPAQSYINKALGGATLMNSAGALVCGTLSQGWCALGFGFAGLTTGSLDYFIGYAGLPDGNPFNSSGTCYSCLKAPTQNGGGAFAAKLTVSAPPFATQRTSPFAMPGSPRRLRTAFATYAPRFDWRTTAVIALQNNVLAPRFKLVRTTTRGIRMQLPTALPRARH